MQDSYARVFGAYDIRGVVGKDLDSPTARAIARAYGDYLCPKEPGSFLIGHDGRWSSPALAEAVLPYAKDLAGRLDPELILLHVRESNVTI